MVISAERAHSSMETLPKKELTGDYLLKSSQFTEAHAESTKHSVQLKVVYA